MKKSRIRLPKLDNRWILAVLGIGLCGLVCGLFVLQVSRASTPSASIEAESGSATSAASVVSDSSASGGKAIEFGNGTVGRGWAKVENGTLVTDQGTLLRGSTLWFMPEATSQYRWATSASPWQYFAPYNLNAVRLAVEYGTNANGGTPLTLAQAESELDTAIAAATAHNLYAIIDLHWSAGAHEQSTAVTFWTDIAARYKDDTNVIFELLNEPVSWHPEDYTAQDIADEEQLYNIARSKAPNTPIILMSFAIPENDNNNSGTTMTDVVNQLSGIDWSNAVVGFHGYWVNNDAGELQLKQNYPVMATEMHEPLSGTTGEYQLVNGYTYYARAMEEDGISWMCWNCNDKDGHYTVLDSLKQDAMTNGYWWSADQ